MTSRQILTKERMCTIIVTETVLCRGLVLPTADGIVTQLSAWKHAVTSERSSRNMTPSQGPIRSARRLLRPFHHHRRLHIEIYCRVQRRRLLTNAPALTGMTNLDQRTLSRHSRAWQHHRRINDTLSSEPLFDRELPEVTIM